MVALPARPTSVSSNPALRSVVGSGFIWQHPLKLKKTR
jgi:hypothetical protein